MTRIAGKDGVYATKGYSSFLYSRDVKGWRDMAVLKFEDTDVTNVTIDNATAPSPSSTTRARRPRASSRRAKTEASSRSRTTTSRS